MKRFLHFFKANLGLHLTLLISSGAIGLYFLLRPYKGFMNFLIQWVTTPYKKLMAAILSILPSSFAEWIWAAAIVALLILLPQTIYRLIRPGKRGRFLILYRRLLGALCAGLVTYAGFCLLWGINYYGDSFSDQSGIAAQPVGAEDLRTTAGRFALLANDFSSRVERNENGLFAVPREEILNRSRTIYQAVGEELHFLAGESHKPKPVFFSKIMSLIDFTGFFFPFTGEANVNMDSPACMFPVTVAHELAHQKNIAPEQEANFVAILTSLKSGDPVFGYSAALLGYVHLANALYDADREAWKEVSGLINDTVRGDLSDNNAYWAQFDTPVSQATQSVYNSFLQSYGQTLGVKSYGACVDLLVAYYRDGIR